MGHAIPSGQGIVNQPATRQASRTPTESGRALTAGDSSAIEKLPEDSIQNSIPARFEALAKRHPGKTAFEAGKERVTFGALDQLANQIALVVEQDDDPRIGLFFKQGIHMLAAQLGVLKAGRTYVPLDSDYPAERLDFIIDDANISHIITEADQVENLRDLTGEKCSILLIEDLQTDTGHIPRESEVDPNEIAYIMYTSGSTGQPKGVLQTHKNLIHFSRSYTRNLGITADDRLSLLFSFSFSAANMDIYSCLLTGATGVLFNLKEEGTNRLGEWIREKEITILHCIPTVLRHFLRQSGSQERYSRIRAIDVAGEPLHGVDIKLYKEYFERSCRLVNHFACTEASVCAQWFINHDTVLPSGALPVGHAAEGVEIDLVDADLNPVPEGETGEIRIRSRYLSPGYWHRPDLTEKSFSAAGLPEGERIYRTGDLGRLNAEGLLLHLGRNDSRVIIRGFTIEVAEIEHALTALPQIAEALVVTEESERAGDPEKRLVAYLETAGPHPTPNQIRQGLSELLPSHMIPSIFMAVESMPKLPNGKIDRQAVSRGVAAERLANVYAAPQSELEVDLCRVWQETLHVHRVGLHDNFFDLGGDSLSAVGLFVAMEKLLSRSLRLSALVEAPTVGQLSRVIEGETAKDIPGVVTFRPTGSRPPLFFLSGIGGTVFCFRELAGMLNPDRPMHGLPFPGFDEGDTVILDEVESIAETLIKRIRQSQPKGPYYLCGYSMGGVVAYEMARQLTQADESVPFVGLLDSRAAPTKRKKPSLERARLHWEHFRTLNSKERLLFFRRALQRLLARLPSKPGSHGKPRMARRTAPVSERLTQVRAATKRAVNQYVPEAFDGSVTLFRCEQVPHWYAFQQTDELRGWGDLARGGVTVEEIPGHHVEIFEPENVAGLATKLEAALEEVDRGQLNLKRT